MSRSRGEQGHGVEGVAAEVKRGDRPEQRDRDGDGDDQGGAQIAQEEEHDQSGEQGAFDEVLIERAHDLANRPRLVHRVFDLHARRKLRPDLALDALAHRLDHGDGIGVGDLDDADAHRRAAVEARDLAKIGQAVDHRGEILEPDRRPRGGGSAFRRAPRHYGTRDRA